VNILVTGAAGYIGSIITEQLIESGYLVIALDNLKQGHRQAVAPELTFVQADLGDSQRLDDIVRSYSVIEVIETARKVTGAPIPVTICPRRPRDPAVLVASSELAKSELGWQPEFPDIESIVKSTRRWQKNHPHGYS